MKKILLSSAFGLALLSSSDGAAIAVAAAFDNGFSVSSSTNANNATDDVAVNNLVRVGYFNISNADIQANAFNIAFLNQNFVEFGTVRMGQGFGVAGHFQGSIDKPTSDVEGFAGKQVFLWVFSSRDNSSVGRSLETATDHGIFSRNPFNPNVPEASNWKFKATSDIPNNSSIDITDLTNAAGNALAAEAQILVGSFPKGVSEATGAPNFALAPVPEPSVAATALLGGAAMLLRRRRTV
jgi:hypothetical protein